MADFDFDSLPDAPTEKPAFDFDSLPDAEPTTLASKGFDFDALPDAEPKVGYTESAVRGAAQGISFNTADELTGLTEALAAKAEGSRESFSQLYSRHRDEARAAYDAAKTANPKTFLASEIASGLAVPSAGWLSAGKTLGSAVKAGALAGGLAGFGAAEGDVGEQALDTVTGAALGAGGGAAAHGLVTGISKLLGSSTRSAAQSLPELAPLAAKIKDTIPDNMGEAVKGQDSEFMQYILRTKVPETVEEAFQKTGGVQNQRAAKIMDRAMDNQDQFERVFNQFDPKLQAKLYDEYRNAQSYAQAARQLKTTFMNKLRVSESDPVQGWMSWIRPANYNAQRVDSKYGSDFTGAILDAITAENKLASGSTPFLKQAMSVESSITDAFKKQSKFDNLDDFSRDLYMRVTQGKFKPGSLEDDVAKYFTKARDTLNKEYGLNIQQLTPYGKQAVYLPRTRMDLDSMRLKLDRSTDKLFQGGMNPKEEKAYWDAMKYLGKEFGADLNPSTPKNEIKQFIENRLIKSAEDRGSVKRLEAAAAFGRDHDLPPYIVEYDIPKLMANYIHGNMKAGLYQQPMARMSAQIDAARTLGMPKTAEYFQGLQDNLMGTPSAWKAKMQERASQWRLHGQRTMDDATTPFGKLQGALQKTTPDFLPWAMGNMYTNLLGMNPYSAARNLTQPIMSGSTDIAARAGYPYAAKVTAQAFKNMLTDRATDPRTIGLAAPGPLRREATEAIIKGLRDSGAPEALVLGIKGVDKVGDALMIMYDGADKINRRWTTAMADQVTKDLFAGSKKAAKIVEALPTGVQLRVKEALTKGQLPRAVDELRRWFNVQHQYSYTTSDMSRLGREFGSMLTAFTKFPASVVSDVEQEIYKNGISGAYPMVRKYLFPLAALSAADANTKESRENMSPAAKAVFGTSFRDLSPALGVVVQPPPMIGAATKILNTGVKTVKGLPDMEPEDMPAAIKQAGLSILEAASPFIPAYGMYNATKKRAERIGLIDKDEE